MSYPLAAIDSALKLEVTNKVINDDGLIETKVTQGLPHRIAQRLRKSRTADDLAEALRHFGEPLPELLHGDERGAGTAIDFLGRLHSWRRTVGSRTCVMRRRVSDSMNGRIRSGYIGAMSWIEVCPKNLNPARAIAEIKRVIVLRRF